MHPGGMAWLVVRLFDVMSTFTVAYTFVPGIVMYRSTELTNPSCPLQDKQRHENSGRHA